MAASVPVRGPLTGERGRSGFGNVLIPIMIGLGDHGDDILDLALEPEVWPGWEPERGFFATDRDVLNDDCAEEPERHFLTVTLHADPTRRVTTEDR